MMRAHRQASPRLLRTFAALILFAFVAGCNHQDGTKVIEPNAKPDAPATTVAQVQTSLAGSSWLAEDIGGKGVIDNAQSTLLFDTAEKVAGSGGCNRYFGSVAITDTTIRFSALGATQRACPPALMNQEQKFFTALTAARTYRYDEPGHKLVLLDVRGTALVKFGGLKP